MSRPRYFETNKVVIAPPKNAASLPTFLHSEGDNALHIGASHSSQLRLSIDSVVALQPLRQAVGGDEFPLLTEVNLPAADDAVFGNATATRQTPAYGPGLVPEGVAGGARFLSEAGLWGAPSEHTGVVTSSFLTLDDTPASYELQHQKYLKVGDGSAIEFGDLAGDIAGLELQAVHTAVLQVTSDVNSKTDVTPMDVELATAAFDEIHPLRFQYKDDPGRECVGVLAQDVERAMPSAVRSGTPYKTVDYVQLVGLLVAVVKPMLTRVNALEEKLTELVESLAV